MTDREKNNTQQTNQINAIGEKKNAHKYETGYSLSP